MHTQGQVIDFIEKAFGSCVLSNGGLNASVVCPKCAEKQDNLQKRKLVIRTSDFLTHCWVCGYKSGNLVNLLVTHSPHLLEEYKQKFKVQQAFKRCITFDPAHLFDKPVEASLPPLQLPVGFTLIANHLDGSCKAATDAWKYLKSRGITESELWLWKFGVTEHRTVKGEQNYRFRVIVPSFDQNGKLNYYSARSYWSGLKGPKYINPNVPREHTIFNELNIDWEQELTLVEGPFDLFKCNENATCILGSVMDSSYLLFQRIVERNTPVLLALDPDAKVKTFNLAKLLLEYGIDVRIFQVPSDVADVGEMAKARFIKESQNAKPFTMNDMLQYRLSQV
jgi:hypothetical protein